MDFNETMLEAIAQEYDADGINPKTGFTQDENECHLYLQKAYARFLNMPRQHPDEMRDFVDSFHRLQDLLAVRIVRRLYPDGWPTHSD